MTTVTAETLADWMGRETPPVVVDIRPPADYDAWHIPGSVNVDIHDDLQEDPARARAALDDLPADRPLVTVCARGVVSQTATAVLRELGYDASTLEGGMAGWSRLHLAAPVPVDIDGTLLQVARPGKGCLSYVLVSNGQAVVFDPSQYVDEYADRLAAHDATAVGVYDTHGHADHLSGGPALADRVGVPYHLHPDDAVAVDASPVRDGDSIAVGDVTVDVRHTPGHSPGSVTYDIEGVALLTGDTLFHESVGRVELGARVGIDETAVERHAETLYESLQHLLDRDGDPLVLPAHDPGSPFPPVAVGLREVTERNRDLGVDRDTFVDRLGADAPELPPNVRQIKRANVGLETIEDDARTDLELGPNRCAAD